MGGLFHKLRHARRCYVVCTIPRSGSNLLTDGLRATRRAGMPKQFFLPKFESRYGAELGVDPVADYFAYVRGIVNTKTTHNEVFGFKLMSWYLQDFVNRLRGAQGFGSSATTDWSCCAALFPVFALSELCDVTNCARHCPRLAHFRQDFGRCRKAKAF